MLVLQLACQALRLSGEVINTSFTFAATAHVLYWNRITPVFCDIDPNTFNFEHDRIESIITPNTTAILPVHVSGYPCDTQIREIADRYGLRVICDAAHFFGVEGKRRKNSLYEMISKIHPKLVNGFKQIQDGNLDTADNKLVFHSI